MKMFIFFSSFFSMNCSGSKSFTSPANRVENADASKRVIGAMPLVPAHSASQLACVPIPTGDTRPTPVTTTRLFIDRLLFFRVRLDVVDRFLDARDLLRFLVRDFDAELFFERHHQLDGVERIGAQVVHER